MPSLDLSALQSNPLHQQAETSFATAIPTLQKRWYWKGNHGKNKNCDHRGGVCASRFLAGDEERPSGWVNSASGSVIPDIQPFPTDKRHRITHEEEGDNSSGELEMGYAAKGFIPLEMVVVGLAAQKAQKLRLIAEIMAMTRPDDEILSVLRERAGREHTTTNEGKGFLADKTEKEVEGIHTKFDKANAKASVNAPTNAPTSTSTNTHAPKQGSFRG